ncbi:MAG TPA: hypothetical protein VJH25_02225 [Candidatus Paceibacterota bacterium]
MNWIKKHTVNIFLIIGSVVATIVFIDIALHFTHYKYAIRRDNYPRYYFVKDDELGLDISLNFATGTHYFDDAAFPVWSNNIGCFDRDYTGETPYIYMAGDSLTWSFVPFEDSWGKKIEELLETRTVKCGVTGGYGTKQEYIKASRLFSKLPAPELIIVGYTKINDFDDDANFPINTVHNGYLVKNLAKGGVTEAEAEEKYIRFDKYCTIDALTHPIIQRTRCFLGNYSVLYNLIKGDIRSKLPLVFPRLARKLESMGVFAPQQVTPDVKSNTEYEKHLQNIVAFKNLAQSEGSKLLFVLGHFDNEKLKSFLEGEGIAYIDLRLIFEEHSKTEPLIWPKDGHWNIAGNELVGRVVSDYIIEHNLIQTAKE